MSLDVDQLRALFDLLAEKDIAEFEHEEAGTRLRVTRAGARITSLPLGAGLPSPVAQSIVPPPAGAGAIDGGAVNGDWVDVTSPFVGSFYRSPSPDTPAFVEVGSVVRAGQTLCIIEAMKLMNEIEAEWSGTVVEVFAQNGKSVEYGQKLFRIKKA
ncbi:MAG TPA: acetyl-CoA carboxylase biotin carboxyl carrier protein [Polyangiaceae bacterium]|nr:acetyl-CoA carboxylase biotin carboxyl carrier protein [Polyangiaceae bacterium]